MKRLEEPYEKDRHKEHAQPNPRPHREIFADAVTDRAAGIVIAHNHPSGQCFPSAEDRRITRRIKEASQIMGIELIDHVIVTKEGWYSFAEEGEL